MPQPYTGEALKTYERIHVLRAYHYNKLYISPEKIIYHVNRHGFLHAYTAGKCRDYDGSKIYYIRDNLLTRENLLRESFTTFYHSKEEAKAAWEAMQADAEANTAEERPQEAATADGTTAGGETITTTETEPQRAAERPQADAEPHNPANDQEPKTAADCHREPATRSGQTTQGAAPCHHPHRPATSPTEARNARRRTNYHHSRKNATQSHAGSPQEIRSARTCHRWKQRTPLPYIASPQPIRSAADCHRRNLPQGAQQAPQRTEPAQAIHAPPCHRKSHHKPRRKAAPEHTGRQKQLFLETIGSASRFSGKFSEYPVLQSFFEKSNQKPCGGYMKGYHGGIKK